MEKNSVLAAALSMISRYTKGRYGIHPYTVLYGYAKLIKRDEASLFTMFGDKISTEDLNGARRYFAEKKLDVELVASFMTSVFPWLSAPYEDAISGRENLSSYDLLSQMFCKDDAVFSVFRVGNDVTDVLNYVGTLKQEREDKTSSKEEEISSVPSPVKQEEEKQPKDFRTVSETYRKLRTDLLNVVKGQDHAVTEFVRGCFQGTEINFGSGRERPKATFLFVGPPGVGKTLLAQTAAESLRYPCKTFNMSEYTTDGSCGDLIGVEPSYKNAGEGALTGFVKKNPVSIIIFDEIEKAGKDIIQLFLQILDLGKVTDKFLRRDVSFKDSIIIFTSNACSSIYEGDYSDISRTPKNIILDALKKEKHPGTNVPVFPDAICSRIASGNLIMFNHLGVRTMTGIISENFEKTAEEVFSEYGYKVSVDPKLPLLFLFHHGVAMDARIASSQSRNFIKSEFFELSRQVESHKDMLSGVDTIRFEIDLESDEVEPDILKLFVNPERTDIAILCDEKDRHCFSLPDNYMVHFANDVKELKKLLKDEVLSLILIDPLHGLKESGVRGVSLDDYDSMGIEAIKYLDSEDEQIPLYIIEKDDRLGETDKNTFLQNGAAGIVSIAGTSEQSVSSLLQQIAEENFMEAQGRDFARRGYVLDFNAAQIPDGRTLKVQFHELKKHQALDSESASVLLADAERPKVKFDDVIGASQAKKELKSFIKYLTNPRKYINSGKKPPKGILLYGLPGTGKTMLARAMAGESNVTFIQTSAASFKNKWYGQSEQNVRELFKRAREHAPAIIFIDEIDAIGKQRNGEDPHTESILNAFLTEMDGFKTDPKTPVFVLAATNYKIEDDGSGRMVIDEALLRRFDNKVCVELPNEEERRQYLRLSISRKELGSIDEDTIKNVATRTPGMSLSHMQRVIALANRKAEDRGDSLPCGEDLQNALEEYNHGARKSFGEEYCKSVAIHESGHAYVAWLSGEKPSYMTIESRGNFGGYMAHENCEEKPSYSKDELLWKIRCALAGRAAESTFFGESAALNTGASGDLQSATKCALNMICSYGMIEGQLVALPFDKVMSTPLATQYLEKANKLLWDEMRVTNDLVSDGKDKIRKLANRLLEKNHLTQGEIAEILSEKEG